MLNSKTITAPVTYKALMGGVLSAPQNQKSKAATFWTESLIRQYKWKNLNNGNTNHIFQNENDKLTDVQN